MGRGEPAAVVVVDVSGDKDDDGGDDDDDDLAAEEAARPTARHEYATRPLTRRILVRRMSRRGRGKKPLGLPTRDIKRAFFVSAYTIGHIYGTEHEETTGVFADTLENGGDAHN